MPATLCVPASFEPGEFLKERQLLECWDDARYLISLILRKRAWNQVDDRGFVHLMARHLHAVMRKQHCRRVIDALLAGGAIQRSSYAVGQHPFGYRLGERYFSDRHVRVPVTCPRLAQRLARAREQADAERRRSMLPVHHELERRQRRLQIDGDHAREILRGLPAASNPFDVQGLQISDIERREFHLAVGTYGRVFNNITSMKRELRRALQVNRTTLEHVDLVNCQPSLIAKIRDEQGEEGTAKGQNGTEGIYDSRDTVRPNCDFDRYRELVLSGKFYEFLLDAVRIGACPNLTRDQLKKRFLCDVIAKRKANRKGAEYPSEVEECFRSEFPAVYQFIRAINREGWEHENLIRLLQREESRLVVETVAYDVMSRHPELFLVTLHDAIYTTPDGIPLIIEAFERAFARTGFRMALKHSR